MPQEISYDGDALSTLESWSSLKPSQRTLVFLSRLGDGKTQEEILALATQKGVVTGWLKWEIQYAAKLHSAPNTEARVEILKSRSGSWYNAMLTNYINKEIPEAEQYPLRTIERRQPRGILRAAEPIEPVPAPTPAPRRRRARSVESGE